MKNFWNNNWKYILVIILITLFVSATVLYKHNTQNKQNIETNIDYTYLIIFTHIQTFYTI